VKVGHLYVHIPFCRARCAYCDFASEPLRPTERTDDAVERYLGVLRAELAARAETGAGEGDFGTIYMGGGTPTSLPLGLLLELAEELASRLVPGGEFTIEANPGTVDEVSLRRLAEAGATRVSLGVQSFSPALRAALGRRVTQEEIEVALDAIAAAGWHEWNLDLVFGIPGQGWQEAVADLDAAVAAGPTHISLYDLTYTASYESRVKARMGAAARETAGVLSERYYAEAVARLEAAGYHRYEISNFALPGHECRHNQAYWRGEDYLGLGAAAVSTLGCERVTNPGTVADYLAGRPPQREMLSGVVRLWEKAMLGLRTDEGVDEESVARVLDAHALERLLAQGCLERRYGKLRVNPGFLDVSNSVIGTLLVAPGGS
jgi:oxygen-independent coproporphyrinogen-3 oxidase